MDGRGGCCIARYAGGAYDVSKVDRIMLRFRPIAPKPAAGGSVSGSSTPPQKAELGVKTSRWKRRYVKDNKNTSTNSNKKSSIGSSRKRKTPSPNDENEKTAVTLPLLSESPERKMKNTERNNAPIWLNFSNQGNNNNDNGRVEARSALVMLPQAVRIVGSWVKVECVTDPWVEGYALGRTDVEKLMNLEVDTCPGFVSDGLNRVRWANKAYKEMVRDDGEGEVVVWLVMEEGVRLPENINTAAFTCRVRVVRSGKEKNNSLILPCDVWRMDGGGYAWRLDTKAALSLGR